MLVAFMSFAFFYLVIGDLIVFHQKTLFNYDVFSQQPINKPGDKKEKHSYFSVKDKKSKSFHSLLTFVSSLEEVNTDFNFTHIVSFIETSFTVGFSSELFSTISFRGPPVLG